MSVYPFVNFPPHFSRRLFAHLIRALPHPEDDTQESLDDRDMIAMTAITALNPTDTIEALLAIQVVTTEARAGECLRLSVVHRGDTKTALRCRGLAATYLRRMERALHLLEEWQSRRPIAMPEPIPLPEPREPAPADNTPAGEPAATRPPSRQAEPDPQDPTAAIQAAEAYFLTHPVPALRFRLKCEAPDAIVAALLRHQQPRDPAIIRALQHAHSPILDAMDLAAKERIVEPVLY